MQRQGHRGQRLGLKNRRALPVLPVDLPGRPGGSTAACGDVRRIIQVFVVPGGEVGYRDPGTHPPPESGSVCRSEQRHHAATAATEQEKSVTVYGIAIRNGGHAVDDILDRNSRAASLARTRVGNQVGSAELGQEEPPATLLAESEHPGNLVMAVVAPGMEPHHERYRCCAARVVEQRLFRRAVAGRDAENFNNS